jgi:hypothetical protein
MKGEMSKRDKTWQTALLATSGLAALLFAAGQVWAAGYPQWGFLLAFAGIWALITVSWSNVDYTEESGIILADIMDCNFKQLHERIGQLEAEIQGLLEKQAGKAARETPAEFEKSPHGERSIEPRFRV